MDTALFYPSYLNLTAEAATDILRPLVKSAESYGGVLTINWHDRSLAPERLWGGFYAQFLAELKRRAPWFATVAQATAWFRQRRSVVLEAIRSDGDAVHVRATARCEQGLPGLRLRIYSPQTANGNGASAGHRADTFTDVSFTDGVDADVRLTPGIPRQREDYQAIADR